MKRFFYILLISFLAVIVPFSLIWANHLFVTGLNPFLGAVSVLLMVLIGGFLAVRVLYVLVKRRAQNRAYPPAILFAMGSVCCLFAAMLKVLLAETNTLDIQLHDTYFVISLSYILKAIALLFSLFAAIYYWYPRWFDRTLNVTVAYIHFWVTFIGAYFVFWPTRYEGLAGMPRRYIDYSGALPSHYFGGGPPFMSIVVIGILLAQLLFVFNFFYSLVKGKKVAGPR